MTAQQAHVRLLTSREIARSLRIRLLETSGRNLDAEWLMRDLAYVLEVQSICLSLHAPEFDIWAARLEQLATAIRRAQTDDCKTRASTCDPLSTAPIEKACGNAVHGSKAHRDLDLEVDVELDFQQL